MYIIIAVYTTTAIASELLEKISDNQQSAVHTAALHGNDIGMIKALKSGKSVFARDTKGLQALDYAKKSAMQDTLKSLALLQASTRTLAQAEHPRLGCDSPAQSLTSHVLELIHHAAQESIIDEYRDEARAERWFSFRHRYGYSLDDIALVYRQACNADDSETLAALQEHLDAELIGHVQACVISLQFDDQGNIEESLRRLIAQLYKKARFIRSFATLEEVYELSDKDDTPPGYAALIASLTDVEPKK